jgi:hypothetical protein
MKRASTILVFTVAVVLTSIAINSLAQAPDREPRLAGTYSLVVSPSANNDARLFFIDTQRGRIWWSTFNDRNWQWQEIRPPIPR